MIPTPIISARAIAIAALAAASLAACSDRNATTTTSENTMVAGAGTPTSSPDRVRGTITAITPEALSIKTYGGEQVSVPIAATTGYAWVVGSSLSTLKNGDFIGTATSGPDDALKAVEVVIFPEALRGTGEGHYDWDTPGVVASGGASAGRDSGMTNGTVTQSAMTNGAVQQSGMTNGTVAQGAGGANATSLTVSYKGGTAKVDVPPGIPVVRLDPTTKASVAVGQKAFVKLGGKEGDTNRPAQFVAVGKDGLTPPM